MDLIKLHLRNIENLLQKRLSYLGKPFISRSLLNSLDYRLLASLAAVSAEFSVKPDELAATKPFTFFLHVFFGLVQQTDMLIQELDQCIEQLNEQQQDYLPVAMQLASIRLDHTNRLPASNSLRLHLARHAANIEASLLSDWLQLADEPLSAACLSRLGAQGEAAFLPIIREYLGTTSHLIRAASYHALILNGCAEATKKLAQESAETLASCPPSLLAACWLYPDSFYHQTPLCQAWTGNPRAISTLMEQMQDVSSKNEAYTAWLWLTGRSLPHYPALQIADQQSRHTAPSTTTYPDTAAALRWWQRQTWSPEKRYFLGQPVDPSGLQQIAETLTGQCLPLLAVHQQLHKLPVTPALLGFSLTQGVQACRFS